MRGQHCFQTQGYRAGDRGLRSVTAQPKEGDTFSLPRWLAHSDRVARRVEEAPQEQRDAAVLGYSRHRKEHGESIHRYFGDPGLQVALARYAGPVHERAIEVLRERLTGARFTSELTPLERAEIQLLAADPREFISCTARRLRMART